MPKKRRKNHVNLKHKYIVESGGGIYVRGMFLHLVLFNSPQTGFTLALPKDRLTPEAVREKIAASNKAFGIGGK